MTSSKRIRLGGRLCLGLRCRYSALWGRLFSTFPRGLCQHWAGVARRAPGKGGFAGTEGAGAFRAPALCCPSENRSRNRARDPFHPSVWNASTVLPP